MSCQIADIVAFFDVGSDLILIYKLSENFQNCVHYVVEMQQDWNDTSSSYYLINENEKIQCLFDLLKRKECCLENLEEMFVVKALKFYEIMKDEKDREQSPQIVGAFNYNPVGSDFQCNISDIKKVTYNKIFNNYERLGDGGFPIF